MLVLLLNLPLNGAAGAHVRQGLVLGKWPEATGVEAEDAGPHLSPQNTTGTGVGGHGADRQGAMCTGARISPGNKLDLQPLEKTEPGQSFQGHS